MGLLVSSFPVLAFSGLKSESSSEWYSGFEPRLDRFPTGEIRGSVSVINFFSLALAGEMGVTAVGGEGDGSSWRSKEEVGALDKLGEAGGELAGLRGEERLELTSIFDVSVCGRKGKCKGKRLR